MRRQRVQMLALRTFLIPFLVTVVHGTDNKNVINLASIASNHLGQYGAQPSTLDFIKSFSSARSTCLDKMVNKECAGHIGEWSKMLRTGESFLEANKWAAQMVDSWGQFPEGLLSGHVNALGDFDECISIEVTNLETKENIPKKFEGRYCTAYFVDYQSSMEAAGLLNEGGKSRKANVFMTDRNGTIFQESVSFEELVKIFVTQFEQGMTTFGTILPSTATCLPNSCSQEDIQYHLTCSLLELYESLPPLAPITSKLPFPYVSVCEEKSSIADSWSIADTFMTIILTSLVAVSLFAGVMDYYWQSQTKSGSIEKRADPLLMYGNAYRYFMAFSVYSNTKKWLSTRKSAEDFGCLHGIRFLSTCWVVLCHSYYVFGILPVWNLIDVKRLPKAWTMMPLLNGTFSVDSFFVMSGMLATYNILKLLDKTNGKMNIIMFYVHRYLRLTPTYAILVGLMATLVVYTGNGPMWFAMEAQAEFCRTKWWTNLLYINNLVNLDEKCNGESWYLANDMQFYVLAPFIVYPLWKWKIPGLSLLALYTILSCVSPVLVVHYAGAYPVAALTANVGENFNEIYQRPWSRIQTFLAGVWLGWILYQTRGKKVFIPKILVAALWILSTGLVLTVIYAVRPWFELGYEIPKTAGYFYAGLSRFTYAVGLCWVIFACIKGYGGIVNKFLSWSVFMPLGRLTFCVYLTSIHIQMIFHFRLSVLMKYDTYTMINLFFAHMVMSLLVGYVCTILFESPFIVLQKLIFERPSREPELRQRKNSNDTAPSKRYGVFYEKEDTIIRVPEDQTQNPKA